MAIVEATRLITGGVDTHAELHVAAVVDQLGGVIGIETFETTDVGYQRLVGWFRSHGQVDHVGVEGTGSYGAGVTRHLSGAGLDVDEVDRPNRQARHRAGKSDSIDAVAAARAALAGTAMGCAEVPGRQRRSHLVVTAARRSAASERIAALNQLRHLVFTAGPATRQRLDGLSPARLVKTAAALRPRQSDPVRYATLLAIRTLARRVAYLGGAGRDAGWRDLRDRTADHSRIEGHSLVDGLGTGWAAWPPRRELSGPAPAIQGSRARIVRRSGRKVGS